MPELPEIETVARELSRSPILHSKITDLKLLWPKTFAGNFEQARTKLLGCRILKFSRRAKYLLFEMDQASFLIAHFRMSGQLFVKKSDEEFLKHEHLLLHFENGLCLRFHDPRKFGRFYLSDDLNTFFQKVGVEPLSDDFSQSTLLTLIEGVDRCLKPFLLDQSKVAGLGNIYVDESLWLSKIHPLRKTSSLTKEEVSRLYKSIRSVLGRAIDARGTSLGLGEGNFHTVNGNPGGHQAFLQVFQREGRPCARCSIPIKKIVVAQRGTHYCPKCQNAP